MIREFIINLPYEFNDSSNPDYQAVHIRGSVFKIFPAIINGILENFIIACFQSSQISNYVLASVLSGGTLSVWPVNGTPVVSLSVNYVILHKIGIANWFPLSHASSVSVALGMFLYQICTD